MKNIRIFAMVAIAAVVLASCSSLDSKISKYEKACKAGDVQKAAEIAADIEKNYKPSDFTQEQTKKLLEAGIECAKNTSSAAASALGSAMEEEDED